MNAFDALKRGQVDFCSLQLALVPSSKASSSNCSKPVKATRVQGLPVDDGSGQQLSLLRWFRPRAWMSQPFSLTEDVASLVVEALMREASVLTMKAFAMVNRTCAAATSATLQSTCVQLRRHAALLVCEVDQEHKVPQFERFMASVGIPQARRRLLKQVPERVWFQDKRSLLGHLVNGCELCGSTEGIDDCVWSGPVVLFACGKCRAKGRVQIGFTCNRQITGCKIAATVDMRETEAHNYARALLNRQSVHIRRMLSKRPGAMSPANLSKRVQVVCPNDELLLCLCKSTPFSRRGPWLLELWHELPLGIPQRFAFDVVMGVRHSDAVREEAQRHAARRRLVKVEACRQRDAMSRLVRKHAGACQSVWGVNGMGGGVAGWVQVIRLCTVARSFSARWLFHPPESPLTATVDYRRMRYVLLGWDQDALDAAVLRVATVARVLSLRLKGTNLFTVAERCAMLQIMESLPARFLECPVAHVHEVVDMLCDAPVALALVGGEDGVTPQTLHIEYTPCTKAPFVLTSRMNRHTLARMVRNARPPSVKPVGDDGKMRASAMVEKLARVANFREPNYRYLARIAIFKLSLHWPAWLVGPHLS
jgi:hypothetical protein